MNKKELFVYLQKKCISNYGLFINPKKKKPKFLNEKEYLYFGSVINSKLSYLIKNILKEDHFLVNMTGQDAYKELNHYYVRYKERREVYILTLKRSQIAKLAKEGKQGFEKKYHVKLHENQWKFFGIRSDEKIIFYKKNPIDVSTNDMELIWEERLFRRGGITYYYEYKNKKYLQSERFHSGYQIWTRDRVEIYPYKYQYELKEELKKLKESLKRKKLIRRIT